MHFIQFWDREEAQVCYNNQGQAIKPGSNISQAPEPNKVLKKLKWFQLVRWEFQLLRGTQWVQTTNELKDKYREYTHLQRVDYIFHQENTSKFGYRGIEMFE